MAQARAIIVCGWRFVWAGTCSAAAMRYRFGRSHLLQYALDMRRLLLALVLMPMSIAVHAE